MQNGKITQIIGPVVDVEFPGDPPQIYNALHVERAGAILVLEVEQHLGGGEVRAIAMSSTDGLQRGLAVKDTGAPISVPVGKETLGRIFDVTGTPLDSYGAVQTKKRHPIHRSAPEFTEQSTQTEILETGIRSLTSSARSERRQGRTVWRRGRRENSGHSGTHPQHRAGTRRLFDVCRCRGAHA